MGIERESTVRARLDGVEEVTRGAQKIGSAWNDAGTGISKTFKGAGGAIRDAVQGVVSDLGHVVTAAGAISFASSVQQVHQLENAVAQLGVGSSRSIRSVQDGVNELSKDINELPNQTAAWVTSVGQLTYSYENAAKAAKGAREHAAFTGDTFAGVMPLIAAIEKTERGAGNSTRALEIMARQAEQLGTVGGVRALGDMFQHLEGQISNLSGSDALGKTTALLAGFGGNKGYTPQQRERALGSVMSRIESNPEGFERFLGHKITDEYGHVENMTKTLKELADYGKRGKGQRLREQFTFGAEGVGALLHTDFDAVERAGQATPSGAEAAALARLKDTPAGRRQAAEVQKSITMQGTVGAGSIIGDASDWLHEKSAEHPILTTLGISAGMKFLGAGMKTWFGGAAATEAAAAGTGAAAGGAGTGLGVGMGALGLGTAAVVAAGPIAALKTLLELGAASKVKQGFSSKDIGYLEAEQLSARAKTAEAAAAGHRSPGVQAALEAEKERLAHRGGAQSFTEVGGRAPGGAGDPQVKTLVDALVKAGASLQLAQETAAKLVGGSARPVQIEIFDATGLGVESRVRGVQ